MTRFLFWNLNRQDLHGFVRDLARQENADVLILAECGTPPVRMLEELNADAPDHADAHHYAKAPADSHHYAKAAGHAEAPTTPTRPTTSTLPAIAGTCFSLPASSRVC